MNRKQADALIRVSTDGKVKTYAEAQALNVDQQNLLLKNIEKKLVMMNFVDTFNEDILNKFNVFTLKEQIPIGAFLQTVGIGLGESRADTITSPSDYLPPTQAVYGEWYKNYTKTVTYNFTRKYTILINQNLFRLFFTSLNGVGSYLAIYNDLGVKTYMWEMYNTALYYMLLQTRNVRDLGTFNYSNDDDYASQLRLIFDKVMDVLSESLPTTVKLNIGLKQTETTFPKGDTNDSGLDFGNLPAKRNTLLSEKNNRNIRSFPSLNLIISPLLGVQFNRKVLADIYNSDFASFENIFGNVIDAQDQVFNVTDKTQTQDFRKEEGDTPTSDDVTYQILVMSDDSFIMGTNINTEAQNSWAEGEGGATLHRVLHIWTTMAVIPFKNGCKFKFRLTKSA